MFISAIDTHCHLHYGPKELLVPNVLTNIMQEGNCYSAYWDKLSQISEAAHIDKIFISPFDGVLDPNYTEQANEKIFQIVKSIPSLYQWVVITPQNDNSFLQAEQMLKDKKCVGIKIHPYCHKYSIDEYGDKIFSFAQKHRAVVQIHPQDEVDSIVRFANVYPNATYIMAHLGGEHYVNAIKNAKYGNVYTDTSGMASMKNMIVEYAVSQIGSERILFGTDTYSAAAQRGRIEFAMISERDKENILFHNAKLLFKF